MSAKLLSAVLTKHASRKTATGSPGAEALVGIPSGPSAGVGTAVASGAAGGARDGLGVVGASKLLKKLMAKKRQPKLAESHCAAGTIKAEPATNMKRNPVAKPKVTTVKAAGVADVLKGLGRGVANKTKALGTKAVDVVKANPKATIGAGTAGAGLGALTAAGRFHPGDAAKALVAPAAAPTLGEQLGEKASNAWQATKDFAGGFAQDPRKWDLAHGLTAGGVALGGAALLAHLLRKKRKPVLVEQELAEA